MAESPLAVGYFIFRITLEEVNLEFLNAEVYYAMYPSGIVAMLCAAIKRRTFYCLCHLAQIQLQHCI
jgi:hypothetical protein